mmetsp:Transcript_27363/g.59429  ORF Transcript_27363/g.59429 Transcript_27363/m.59429 type:complete len:262 (+) Transcript_27363:1-786(+)
MASFGAGFVQRLDQDALKQRLVASGAKSFCLVCQADGENIVLSNDAEVFPAASLIKLHLAWEVLNPTRNLDLNARHKITPPSFPGYGVLQDLHDGLELTTRDLTALCLTISDNHATNLLIDLVGLEAFNAAMKENGWEKTELQRRMMDFEARARGLDNWTTPRDVASVLRRMIEDTSGRGELLLGLLKRQQHNYLLPSRLPPGVPFAHKTGDIPGVVHDAGVMFVDGQRVVVVLMTTGLSDNGGALFGDVGRMIYDAAKHE